MRVCTHCKESKPDDLFRKWRKVCKECNRTIAREKYANIKNINVLTCNFCKAEKSAQLFASKTKCKECMKNYKKNHYIKNKDEISQQNKKHRDKPENKEKAKEYGKEYRKINDSYLKKQKLQYRNENKEKIRERNKIYRDKNRKHIRLVQNKYYYNNKDKFKEYDRKNRDKINKRSRLYRYKRYRNDVQFRLRINISASVRLYLKNKSLSKNNTSILEHLPYPMLDLKNHIESQFEPWMNWGNWGIYNPDTWDDNDSSTWTWQIDHIIPHSRFEYTSMKDEEFQKCWSLDNLRPLSAKQNILDGNRC